MEIKTLRSVHNYIYANEGLGRTEAFDEVIKILLMKVFDEKHRLGWFFRLLHRFARLPFGNDVDKRHLQRQFEVAGLHHRFWWRLINYRCTGLTVIDWCVILPITELMLAIVIQQQFRARRRRKQTQQIGSADQAVG